MSRFFLIIIALIQATLTACQTVTPGSPAPDASSSNALAPAGYFVDLPAKATAPDAAALFTKLYRAVDAYNRKQADTRGDLTSYVSAFAADGQTRLADGASEIECDAKKCLVKLQARAIRSTGAAGLAGQLTAALALYGVHPKATGTGITAQRTYVLGRRGLGVVCTVHGHGDGAVYRCDFDLERGRAATTTAAAAMASAGRGKLVNCEEAPGVERTALSEVEGVEGGGLLKLAGGTGAGAHPVGYLRYARQGAAVEFLDLYLCGDLSHDYFRVEGQARQPRAWLRGKVDALEQEDAHLAATAKIVEDGPEQVTVEVKFRIGLAGADADKSAAGPGNAGSDAYGDDRFYLHLSKAWMR